jgi:cytochrome c oxidase assembly factor CtaG
LVRGGEWAWEPGIVLPLVVTGLMYASGVRALWSHRVRRGVQTWEVTAFAAGWLVLALALVSPLHEASEQLFSAHMIQHELLMVVAAPLLALGRPAIVMLWSVPLTARRAVGRVVRAPVARTVWSVASRPFDAWLLHAIVIWGWHIPALFQATLHSEVVHAAQHVSFLGSALLFWWIIIHPRRRASHGMSILYLFTTAVHTGVLGALMTVARTPWYPDYAGRAQAWGMTLLEDQQLAGLVMWIPASVVYLVAALLVLHHWLRDSEQRVASDELPWAHSVTPLINVRSL